jgi:TorA maturation chaperone TorD
MLPKKTPVIHADDLSVLRLGAYHLLSQALMKPDEARVRWLKKDFYEAWEQVRDALSSKEQVSLERILRKLKPALQEMSLHTLAKDFDFLFEAYAGLAAPPYETEYTKETPQHSMSQGAQMADIAGFYRAFGLQISSESPDRVDHLSAELEFMHVMAAKEGNARMENNQAHLALVIDAESKFLHEHLTRWPSEFRWRVTSALGQESGIYPLIAELIEWWVNFDARQYKNTP